MTSFFATCVYHSWPCAYAHQRNMALELPEVYQDVFRYFHSMAKLNQNGKPITSWSPRVPLHTGHPTVCAPYISPSFTFERLVCLNGHDSTPCCLQCFPSFLPPRTPAATKFADLLGSVRRGSGPTLEVEGISSSPPPAVLSAPSPPHTPVVPMQSK